MSNECLACHGQLTDDEVYLSCAECDYNYHIGACSGVSQANYRKKSEITRKSWKCNTCKTAPSRRGQDTAKQKEAGLDLAREIADMQSKLTVVLEMQSRLDNIDAIMTTVGCIETAVKAMSDKYDDVLKRMETQSADICDLKKHVEKLEAKVDEQEIKKLRQEMNNLEQYSRQQNMEIFGLPQHTDEKLLERINVLADELELARLSETDVEAVHRLPLRGEGDTSDRIAPVLVRFSSRVIRDKWLSKKSELKKRNSKIYLNENLTAQNKALLWKMKARAKEKEYEFAWFKNGKLFVRRTPRSHIIRIACIDDLEKIR